MKIFSSEVVRYIWVGILNTVIGTTIMFFSYNILGLGYWLSSFLNYFIGSIFSFFANKYFTFKSKRKSFKEVVLFISNIVVCYVLAYGIAVSLINGIFNYLKLNYSPTILEQLALICGMFLFVFLNYIGQKLFVFQVKNK